MHPDFREMLARPNVDAVLIATGNRWHGMASIHAARAGKDIYCETPISLTIGEGRLLVEACRRNGTVYQAGTQRRSTESYRFAVEMVRQGRIGKVHTVEMQVWAAEPVAHDKAVPVPEGWNYDIWLGQVPWRPFVPARVNGWQYFWDTAEGILTDMGCHYTDLMQYGLNRDGSGPMEFEAHGVFADPAKYCNDTPITATARCRYEGGVTGLIYQRGKFEDRYIRFIGDEGWIQVDDHTDVVTASPKSILSMMGVRGKKWADAEAHIRNLLECLRSRRTTLCHPEAAHRATSICQAMNISLRLGRLLNWDPVSERFDLEEANRMLYREPRAPWQV
jgi:predicted dehydrogenase